MIIVPVRIKSADEWDELYQAQLPMGGMFVATTTALEVDGSVVLELASPALPNKVLIRGIVRSWNAARPRLRVRAGGIIEFADDETSKRDFVLRSFAGDEAGALRRRQGRLPVLLPVRYRLANTTSWIVAEVSEISSGGALLALQSAIPLDAEVTLEITPPGAAAPLAISSRVSYHGVEGATGLRFVSRDADGDRRLRELMRRVRES